MGKGRHWFSVLIGALLTLSLTTAPAHAGVCSDFLLASKNYFSEVRESKGLRLLVAPSNGEQQRARYLGFLSHRGWPAPLQGLSSVLVDIPADAVVRGLAGPQKKASLLTKIPMIVGWIILAQVYVINPVTEHAMENRIQSEILENKVVFHQLILDDYRFDSVRREEQAYMVSRAYSSYYRFRDGRQGEFSAEDNAGLLDHYLFGHLRPAIHDGVEVPSGFEKSGSFSERLNEAQVAQLFKLTHSLYFRYQVIDAAIEGAAPELAGLISDLKASSFYKQLEALRVEKKISFSRFKHALQEHAFWEYRLRCYETLGLVKINPETQQPVALEDIDAEILAELQD